MNKIIYPVFLSLVLVVTYCFIDFKDSLNIPVSLSESWSINKKGENYKLKIQLGDSGYLFDSSNNEAYLGYRVLQLLKESKSLLTKQDLSDFTLNLNYQNKSFNYSIDKESVGNDNSFKILIALLKEQNAGT